ncbi:MAG: response regulator transcription factor [Acidimicrobiia bacterium]|nr:response regulator transcription factor [Acidimicrobiia bacterium]
MESARILVVDDDKRIAASVRRALAYEGYKVEVAHDGQSALKAARSSLPDLVVLDVMMPGIDGVEVCRRLREAGDDTVVLMLTAKAEVADRVAGLDAGADDYLVKPFAYEELLARVRSLLRRNQPGSTGDRLTYADVMVDVDAMEVHRSERLVELTALEFRLFEYFMRNPRVVLSRSQILIEVWGLDAETTSNVVDVYIRYLRQKLEKGGEARVIHTIRGAGYVLKEA